MSDNSLGMFAKYWQPGQVKTRLAATLGPEQAAKIYHQFILCLASRLVDFSSDCVLAVAPAEQMNLFRAIAGERWRLESQTSGNLGNRMSSFFKYRFAEGRKQVVILGSDSPNVPSSYIQQAFDQLKAHDVVLGPTADGGYYLIGLSKEIPEAFEGMPWSTPDLWQTTIDRLTESGVSIHVLPPWYDVDELANLKQLLAELQQSNNDDSALVRLRQYLTEVI